MGVLKDIKFCNPYCEPFVEDLNSMIDFFALNKDEFTKFYKTTYTNFQYNLSFDLWLTYKPVILAYLQVQNLLGKFDKYNTKILNEQINKLSKLDLESYHKSLHQQIQELKNSS